MNELHNEGLNDNDEMMAKYLDNLLTPEERLHFEEVLQNNPAVGRQIEAMTVLEQELQMTGQFLRTDSEIITQTGQHLHSALFNPVATSSKVATLLGKTSTWFTGLLGAGTLVLVWFVMNSDSARKTTYNTGAAAPFPAQNVLPANSAEQRDVVDKPLQPNSMYPLSEPNTMPHQPLAKKQVISLPENNGGRLVERKEKPDSVSIYLETTDALLATQIGDKIMTLRKELQHYEASADTMAQIKILRKLAVLSRNSEHIDESIDYYNRCIGFCAAIRASETEAQVLGESAMLYEQMHNRKEAFTRLELCVQLLKSSGSIKITQWENALGKLKNE